MSKDEPEEGENEEEAKAEAENPVEEESKAVPDQEMLEPAPQVSSR